MSSAKKKKKEKAKKHGVATAASRVGKLDEVQRSMSTAPQEWGTGLQCRFCNTLAII